MPLVSVVIPTRDRPCQLRFALQSVFQQEGLGSEFDAEVIVVIDGEGADYTAVENEFQGIRWVKNHVSQGVCAARNKGAERARGEYLVFHDDDDLLLPWKIRLCVEALRGAVTAAVAYGPVYISSPKGLLLWPKVGPSGNVLKNLLLGELSVGVQNCVVRASDFRESGGFDEELATLEDWDLWLRLARRREFVFVPHAVAVWRPSLDGAFARRLQSGVVSETARAVLRRAIRESSGDGVVDVEEDVAWAHVSIDLALSRGMYGDFRGAWDELGRAVCECARLMRVRKGRKLAVNTATTLAGFSSEPLAELLTGCRRLETAAAGKGFGARLAVRKLLGDVCAAAVLRSEAEAREGSSRELLREVARRSLAYWPAHAVRGKVVTAAL